MSERKVIATLSPEDLDRLKALDNEDLSIKEAFTRAVDALTVAHKRECMDLNARNEAFHTECSKKYGYDGLEAIHVDKITGDILEDDRSRRHPLEEFFHELDKGLKRERANG